MTTYTIAMIDDMLAATAVDGDEAMMTQRLQDTLDQLNAEDRANAASRVRYISGLQLFKTEEEAEDAGLEIVYSGCDTGWLQDAEGNMQYMAAAK